MKIKIKAEHHVGLSSASGRHFVIIKMDCCTVGASQSPDSPFVFAPETLRLFFLALSACI
jgi:hypothetical protein